MINTTFNCYHTLCHLCSAIASLVTFISVEHASDVHLQDFLLGGGSQWLDKEMATHSSIVAWRTPWTVEPHGAW